MHRRPCWPGPNPHSRRNDTGPRVGRLSGRAGSGGKADEFAAHGLAGARAGRLAERANRRPFPPRLRRRAGHRIHYVEGIACLSFILPGLLVMTVAARAFANCPASVFQATNEGCAEDVLPSPLRPWQAGAFLHEGRPAARLGRRSHRRVRLASRRAGQRGRRLAPFLVGRFAFSLMRR
jgi:hypothetical protein